MLQPHIVFAQTIVMALQQLGNGELRSRGRALIGSVAPLCYREMKNNARPAENRIPCSTVRVNAENGGVNGASSFIKRSLCENSPAGISVCTGFMRQATTRVNSQFCTQDIPGVPNHGRHAMAVVGYSEGEAGQGRRFLVQNSWGGHCPSHAEAVGITCEKTLDGMNTGRWWIDQELLLNNSYRLERIPPPPAL